MSSEQTISSILVTALLTVAGITSANLVVENQERGPTPSGLWVEANLLPIPETSMGKASTDSDEAEGIFQASVFDPATGTGSKAILDLVDLIKEVFTHGVTLAGPPDVFIDASSRNTGRQSGGYYQVDVSIIYRAFVARP